MLLTVNCYCLEKCWRSSLKKSAPRHRKQPDQAGAKQPNRSRYWHDIARVNSPGVEAAALGVEALAAEEEFEVPGAEGIELRTGPVAAGLERRKQGTAGRAAEVLVKHVPQLVVTTVNFAGRAAFDGAAGERARARRHTDVGQPPAADPAQRLSRCPGVRIIPGSLGIGLRPGDIQYIVINQPAAVVY